jgi:hypothetical protein
MTRCLPACIVAFALAAVGVSAQYPEQKPTEKQSPSAGKTVTITGCVKEGDTPNSFVLSNVDPSSLPGAAGATGTTGTPSAPAGSSATATVQLSSSADIDLKKHVGHKVEISGSIAKPEAGAAGTAGTPSDPKDKSMAPKLTVRSVKHVSESCSM